MADRAFRLPYNSSYEDTFKFLTWEQFPAILERSIKYNSVLPQIGVYRHVNPTVKDFKEALLDTTSREFTLSGVGSLIDYDTYGHQIKKPTPYYTNTGCAGNSLCIEPTCFGFTEGVIESNNLINNICWSLSMPCLKDQFYSDMQFDRKMRNYFSMFFKQPAAVIQAYQRTRLIKEAIKIVATDRNFRFSGPVIGGTDGLSLPFYINPNDALSFPDLDNLGVGVEMGGANLVAFANYLAPRLFSGGAFSGGMEDVKVYGLMQDWTVAKEQTASVQDSYMDQEILRALTMRGAAVGADRVAAIFGDNFIHDGLFPTFKEDTDGVVVPITQEILEPSTIAGYVQTANPEHSLASIRGLLFVPSNWRFNLVEPPRDDFSSLGLGAGLNFRTNSPGVFPIMSSSMFVNNTIGQDRQVILGQGVDPATGMIGQTVRGLVQRERAIQEAIRTQVIMTYSEFTCGPIVEGQLANVGRPAVPQGQADGFALKSTMYLGSDVTGVARPVLLLFKTDTPRSAQPIKVCQVEEVTVDSEGQNQLVACCPGNQSYAILTFNNDMEDEFEVGDLAVYRTGANGASYLVEVTAVSGKVVSISSVDSAGDPAYTELPCCSGVPDDYGVRGELILTTGATALTGNIMKASWDADVSSLFVELYTPVVTHLAGTDGTITLEDGTVIQVTTSDNNPAGVFLTLEADTGETCDLSTLDCGCLVNAVFAFDA